MSRSFRAHSRRPFERLVVSKAINEDGQDGIEAWDEKYPENPVAGADAEEEGGEADG